jgi:hypothetical protein
MEGCDVAHTVTQIPNHNCSGLTSFDVVFHLLNVRRAPRGTFDSSRTLVPPREHRPQPPQPDLRCSRPA